MAHSWRTSRLLIPSHLWVFCTCRRLIPDVGKIVEDLRKQRILLVQTLSQFQFAIETAMAIVIPPSQKPGTVEEDDYDV
jgi:hypothetical protein